MLLERQAIDPDALQDALLAQMTGPGMRLGALLVQSGAIDEETLATVLAARLGLERTNVRDLSPEQAALDLLPEPVARASQVIPVRLHGDVLEVASADPTDEQCDMLKSLTGHRILLTVATASEISRLVDASYRVLSGVDRFVKAFQADDLRRAIPTGNDDEPDAAGDDAPIVRVVGLMITQALRDRASDIHIEPQERRVRVRFRIDGALHEAIELPAAMGPALVSRLKIMATLNIVERRRPQDGQISLELDGRTIDMRLSVLPTIHGEKCVIRLLDTNRAALPLRALGMPSETFTSFSKMIRNPFGMVLCAGPTGSGKTTTLYAALAELNQADRNITTIEDPVEYVFDGINQISVSDQSGMTFASGLKSILRQDPDVILVGEIRDAETARVAVQSALTGHFVLSTVHGTDAVAALHRLLDMGIESFLIASSILAVVGQRLVRRSCSVCQVAYEPTPEEITFYLESGGAPKDVFMKGEGCTFCAETGFQDRIGVYELLRVTPELKRLVVGWATQEELRDLAVSQGMRTLLTEAISLVERDVTTIAEVIRSIYSL
ncbi:MAG: Flp pilus assembly complex ATPase component TadA [Actinomycetota bacterium]|nr:Flp pilus assembly complex ATPase component TadA [Actinomycetota bacterium]